MHVPPFHALEEEEAGPPISRMRANMSIYDLQAIDVHGHYGDYFREAFPTLTNAFMTGSAETVAARAKRAQTRLTFVSPLAALFPRGRADAAAGNDEGVRVVQRHPALRLYAVVHPLQPETFRQARRMLGDRHCVGIKIHPEEHEYPVREHAGPIFELAAETGAIILSHSGDERSMPADLLPFADEFPNVQLILAHLGSGCDNRPDHQVRAIQKSRHGNVYVDTSSAQSIMPGLVEWAVREIGYDRILYGTDTPLYHAPMQRARIDHAEISDEAKAAILCGNAERLFNLHSPLPEAVRVG